LRNLRFEELIHDEAKNHASNSSMHPSRYRRVTDGGELPNFSGNPDADSQIPQRGQQHQNRKHERQTGYPVVYTQACSRIT
jgi:hypothetical protein